MLNYLKAESNMTLTENGAATYESTASYCLDLFATIGAVRNENEDEITKRFIKAFAEDRDTAMKILFYARDIRGGLGERRVFRVLINWLARCETDSMRKNISYIPEYGRYDDLMALFGTPCEKDALELIKKQLEADMKSDTDVSLLAKWLPSVNTSNPSAVAAGKYIARYLGMSDKQYRRTLADLRRKIGIIENNLREKDYTFDYSKQPSKAMFKYRNAFIRNDCERYFEFLEQVKSGITSIHTDTLMPYDIISSCFDEISKEERETIDITWNSLKDYCNDENALAVIDGSGSMYIEINPMPIAVALSLGIYFAERNKGVFKNHFITFSMTPKLVEIMGSDIVEKVRYCAEFNEIANTNLQAVFELILNTALKYSVPQEEMPKKLYIISDMEFDICVSNGNMTNFEKAKQSFENCGYSLPEVVFWNVASRNVQQPVKRNQQGAALVSGCTPRLFSMITEGGIISPYIIMKEIIGSKRYEPITA